MTHFPVVGLSATVVIIVSGLWLTRSGRPFGTVPLALHKLSALGGLVVLGAILFRGDRAALFLPLDWAVTGLAGVLIFGTFATGSIVIVVESTPPWVVWTHRIGSWIAMAAAAWCVRLVVG